MANLLFVCSGNSIRSQIAEGFAREFSDGKHDIKSAGILAIGVHPAAVATMKEIGIDIGDQECTILSKTLLKWADCVVTLCNNAREKCPPIPKGIRYMHWDVPNPEAAPTPPDERRLIYARMRDDIKDRVTELLETLKP